MKKVFTPEEYKKTKNHLSEVRCPKCNRVLLKCSAASEIEVKCSECNWIVDIAPQSQTSVTEFEQTATGYWRVVKDDGTQE